MLRKSGTINTPHTALFGIMWIIIGAVLTLTFSFSWLDRDHYQAGWVGHKSIGLNCAIATLFTIFFYIVAKQVTGLWRIVDSNSPLLPIYERFLIPITAMLYPMGLDYIVVQPVEAFRSATTVVTFLLLWIALADPFNFVERYLRGSGLLEVKGVQMFILRSPPQSFVDIVPLFVVSHLVFFGVWL